MGRYLVVFKLRQPKLADFPELAYFLGLLDSERAIRPVRRQRAKAVAFDPGDLQTGRGRSVANPAVAVFAAWLKQTAASRKPALVRTSKLSNANYLGARRITDFALAAQPTRE